MLPPPALASKPGWHWICCPTKRLPWKWLPATKLWEHNNSSITPKRAAELGWTYWAPAPDAPATKWSPAPLFEPASREAAR